MKEIIIGGGCFWCVEAIFQRVRGVTHVTSGYSGGIGDTPTYESVSAHIGNFAEVVKIEYDDSIIALREILDIFFHLHDPTTINQQGADRGPQYRSIVFYSTSEEHVLVEDALSKAQKDWPNPIVTEVVRVQTFYKAEDYHQNYFNNNPTQGYCNVIISPKLAKLKEKYFEKLV